MNVINYRTLYLDFLQDNAVVLPNNIRFQLINMINKYNNNQFSTQRLASINAAIKKHIKRKLTQEISDSTSNSYDKNHIKYILAYQVTYKMNNVEVSSQFKLSRNTLAKWKRMFSE